ncbi:hypothetical protein RND81_10G187400 [Saponaria officinalis]|uniref:FAD-binding PCMH-type domain-containing protein n=1 Tax=Saponaria officinalis TaxID=3572 RepID=A0AAW1I6A2_SAPOF
MIVLTSLIFLLNSMNKFPTTSSITTNENFLNCFLNSTQKSYNNISQIIYSPTNSAFSSVLQAYIRNLRFNPTKFTNPEFIITPVQKTHVSAAIFCSRNSGLTLKTRSGGHDFEGLSYKSDNVPFIILDMFNLREIDVDIDTEIAYVESGAILGELYYKISESSKVHGFPAGICPSVGIGGHISGGGYGNLLRKYGLSVDNVVDAELVDVNGRILDRKLMGEDLFWAIRGGGGASFGVVLSYTLRLVRVPEVVTCFRVERFEVDNLTDLVFKWQTVMQNVDSNLFIRLILQPVTRNNNSDIKVVRVTFMSLFLGRVDRLMSVMNSEFPELGLLRDDCVELSWIQSVLFWSNYDYQTSTEVLLNRTYPATYLKRKSDYVMKPISKTGLDSLWKKLAELGNPGLVFNPYGGKMSEISTSETPFPHRSGNMYKIQYSINWEKDDSDEEKKCLNMIRELYDFMTPYVSESPRSAYLNYRDIDIGVSHNFCYEEGKVYGEKYFRGNFERLVKVKSKVDGDNFFRNEQSIPTIKSSSDKLRVVYVVFFVNVIVTWFSCGRLFN